MILPPLIIALLAVGSAVAADSPAAGPGSFVPPRKGKGFQRFGMVLMGGTNFSDAATQATFQSFRELENGRTLSNYVSVGRDPLPNHVAAIAGTTYGLENCPGGADSLRQCRFNGMTLIDLFEALNVSYRFYAEDYQGGCDLSTHASSIPALHSTKVQETPEWCEKVVNATQFQKDISSNSLPQVWFYTPNSENGGGSGISPNQNHCISTVFIPLLQNTEFSKDLLFVLSYNDFNPKAGPASSSRVWTGLAGGALGAVAQGAPRQDDTLYNPFSITRTIENNWNLGALGKNDTRAELLYLGQLPKPAQQQYA